MYPWINPVNQSEGLSLDLNLVLPNSWLNLGMVNIPNHTVFLYSGTLTNNDSRAPYSYEKEKETHQWIFSHMVIMANGIAHGHVRTTTATTESRNMAAILQMLGWQRHAALVLILFTSLIFAHPCYDQLTPVKARYPLTGITWPHGGLKCTAHWGHLFFLKLTADQVLLLYWIAGSC